MKKLCLLLWSFVIEFLPVTAYAQTGTRMELDSVLCLGLPVVEVVTEDSIEPTAEQAEKPEGTSGQSVVNATKVPGRLRIWSPAGETVYDSGEFEAGQSGMTIKIRGNNSALQKLKPYKVKLQKKADLLRRGDEARFKDRNWLLLKEYRQSLNIPIGFRVSTLVGMPWTPACKEVNLLMNGLYRGIYLLTEQVSRNPRCRINVDEDTGFIVERDIYWWVAPLWFETGMVQGNWMKYTLKYPNEDEVTEERIEDIRRQMNGMEAGIRADDYEGVLDVRSFAAWLLVHDLLGTSDGGGSNRFMAKYDNTEESRVFMPCVWDFDTNFRMDSIWSALHDYQGSYHYNLFASQNKAFAKAYVQLWKEVSPLVVEEMETWLDSLLRSEESRALDVSRRMERQCGFYPYVSVEKNVEVARDWFRQRKQWMDEHIAEVDTVDGRNAIEQIRILESVNRQSFDLSGRRLSAPPAKGLYIENGKVKGR